MRFSTIQPRNFQFIDSQPVYSLVSVIFLLFFKNNWHKMWINFLIDVWKSSPIKSEALGKTRKLLFFLILFIYFDRVSLTSRSRLILNSSSTFWDSVLTGSVEENSEAASGDRRVKETSLTSADGAVCFRQGQAQQNRIGDKERGYLEFIKVLWGVGGSFSWGCLLREGGL